LGAPPRPAATSKGRATRRRRGRAQLGRRDWLLEVRVNIDVLR